MGNWKQVVNEQLGIISSVGIRRVNVSHVGPSAALPIVFELAEKHGIKFELIRSDENILHYETFAMCAIEAWAKENSGPLLYFHTKGVSAPNHEGKKRWRHLMEDQVLRRMNEHVPKLGNAFDVIGVNWRDMGRISHFCGNFWLSTGEFIRTLEDFCQFHHSLRCERTSCEFWIGTSSRTPRILSLVHRNVEYFHPSLFA